MTICSIVIHLCLVGSIRAMMRASYSGAWPDHVPDAHPFLSVCCQPCTSAWHHGDLHALRLWHVHVAMPCGVRLSWSGLIQVPRCGPTSGCFTQKGLEGLSSHSSFSDSSHAAADLAFGHVRMQQRTQQLASAVESAIRLQFTGTAMAFRHWPPEIARSHMPKPIPHGHSCTRHLPDLPAAAFTSCPDPCFIRGMKHCPRQPS